MSGIWSSMRVRHGVIEALVASVRFMLCFVCNGCRCNKSFLLITLLVSGSDWADHERLLNHERSSLLSCPLHKVMRLLSIGLGAITTVLFKKLRMSFRPFLAIGESNLSWQFNARKKQRNKKIPRNENNNFPIWQHGSNKFLQKGLLAKLSQNSSQPLTNGKEVWELRSCWCDRRLWYHSTDKNLSGKDERTEKRPAGPNNRKLCQTACARAIQFQLKAEKLIKIAI